MGALEILFIIIIIIIILCNTFNPVKENNRHVLHLRRSSHSGRDSFPIKKQKFKHQAHRPEQGDGKDAGDEEDGVVDEHPGQSDLSWRHAATGRRAGPPGSSLTKLYRRYCRRRRHHHHHHARESDAEDKSDENVQDLLVLKIKLAANNSLHDAVGDRVVGADDVVASEHQKVRSHRHDVDGDDDGGHGGGPEHGLGANQTKTSPGFRVMHS